MAKIKFSKFFKDYLKIILAISIGLPIYQIARIFDLRIVFLFHQISNKPDYFSKSQNLNIKPDNFRKIIKLLIKYFEVVDDYFFFGENQRFFRNKPLILITFDDGYYDAIEESHKISLKYKIPIMHFINTEYIEYNKSHTNKFSPAFEFYNYLENQNSKSSKIFQSVSKNNLLNTQLKYPRRSSINHIKNLKKSKLIFCSHGHNHLKYFDNLDPKKIIFDYKKSKIILKKNGFENHYFAFPFGRVDKKLFELLKKFSINKEYFFLGVGAINKLSSMKKKRLVRRVNITSYDVTFFRILYRISISIIIGLQCKTKNLFNNDKIYH